MIDLSNNQLASDSSSNKLALSGSGTIAVSALGGSGQTSGSATIAHGQGTDNLIVQVTTTGGPTSGVVVPWQSNDGRVFMYTELDSTNLKIIVNSNDSSGLGAPAYTITYYYRILVP